jgi:peroxiredoxin
MTLRAGARAPKFQVALSKTREVSLADYDGAPLLLVFLRHLA